MARVIRTNRDFATWRRAARELLREGVDPYGVAWLDGPVDPRAPRPRVLPGPAGQVHVPREFLEGARVVADARDPNRWTLLYSLLWRMAHDRDLDVLRRSGDGDVTRFLELQREVLADVARLLASAEFRPVVLDVGERLIAWHLPDHFTVKRALPALLERFGSAAWALLTPDGSVDFDGAGLRVGAAVPMSPRIVSDVPAYWRRSHREAFRRARVVRLPVCAAS